MVWHCEIMISFHRLGRSEPTYGHCPNFLTAFPVYILFFNDFYLLLENLFSHIKDLIMHAVCTKAVMFPLTTKSAKLLWHSSKSPHRVEKRANCVSASRLVLCMAPLLLAVTLWQVRWSKILCISFPIYEIGLWLQGVLLFIVKIERNNPWRVRNSDLAHKH